MLIDLNDPKLRPAIVMGLRSALHEIRETFPELRDEFAGADVRAPARAPSSAAPRRGRMTAEGRKRISALMIKRWAAAKRAKRNHL